VTAEAARQRGTDSAPTLIAVAGVVLEAFADGALWWADQRLLAVADLHLEKGSSFARRGQMLPPYDTGETLARLARLIARLNPRVVVAVGDSFHDNGGAARMTTRDRASLAALQAGRQWIWIAGNHDSEAPGSVSGDHHDTFAVGPLLFRHEPVAGSAPGEVAGHLHPAAYVAGRGKWVRRRCFAADGQRIVLPAFGAYAGGLNVLHAAFAGLFERRMFRAFVLGEARVYAVGRTALRPD